MIKYIIYNDDSIRHFYGFPNLKDPTCLETTLLMLANMQYPQERFTSIFDPRLWNKHFIYYTMSNLYSWGELPFGYIYNDMIRNIQNTNTKNNFVFTMESIFIDKNSASKVYDLAENMNNYVAYEIVTAYVTENYLNSRIYMNENGKSVLTFYIPQRYGGLNAYIIGTGFEPYNMAKWFSTEKNIYSLNSLPYTRYVSLKGITEMKLGSNRISLNPGLDLNVYPEMAEGRKREKIEACRDLVGTYELEGLKKKSDLDTEFKYGNFPIDYNWLNIYDIAKPGAMYSYKDKRGETFMFNLFNQCGDYRIDYRLLKKEANLIKGEERKR